MVKLHITPLAAMTTAVLVLCNVGWAFTQGIVPPRAPQGLFGGIGADPNAPKRFDVSVSLIEGFDSEVPVALRPRIDRSSPQIGGYSTMLNTSAGYTWRGARSQVGGNISSMLRRYAEIGETQVAGLSAGVGASVRLPAQTTLLANQSSSYSPTYLYDLFRSPVDVQPGDAGGTAPDYVVGGFESYSHTTTVTLKHDLSPRRFITGIGTLSYVDRLHETPDWKDTNAFGYRARYTQRLSRNSSWTAQYRYRSGEYGYAGEGTVTELGLNVGADYTRPLSATRTAFVRFNVGLSGADIPQTVAGASVLRRRYLGTADLSLGRQFGRTWQAQANLRRSIDYVADIPEPVFGDTVSLGLDGLLTRRLDVSLFAAYSSGESVLNRNGLQFDTYTGSVRVRHALSRMLAAYVEYLYYYYDFNGYTQLALGMPRGLERNGVRAGVTLWVSPLGR